jgi:hypothetical protein
MRVLCSVCAGAERRDPFGVGIVAETAYRRELDADLRALPIGDLFRTCTAWAAFPARTAPAEPALVLVADLAHMEIRAMRRTLALGEAGEWPAPPGWASGGAGGGVSRATDRRAGGVYFFFLEIHVSTFSLNSASGTTPWSMTWAWNSRMSNFAPSSRSACSRSAKISRPPES